MGLSTKAHLWCLPPVKFRHDRLSTFQVIRIWIFSRSGLKVIFTTPNFIFLGVLPHNLGTLFRPQKALPFAEQRVLSPHWSRSDAQCDLWPWQSKKKEKRQWHTGYSPRPPKSPYQSQSLHAGWPPVCSSKGRLKMQDRKMTDQRNINRRKMLDWKMRDWKITD